MNKSTTINNHIIIDKIYDEEGKATTERPILRISPGFQGKKIILFDNDIKDNVNYCGIVEAKMMFLLLKMHLWNIILIK